MINFTRAFDSAWERMHVILFRPFDAGKWFTIGFSAFLAGLLDGGNGFNYRYNNNTNFNYNFNANAGSSGVDWQKIHDQIMNAFRQLNGTAAAYGLIFLGVLVLILAFALVIAWLGARGQFLILDNITRNRGAIAWPWGFYSKQGNSLFFFHLIVMVLSLAVFVPMLIVGVLMAIPLFQQDRWPAGHEIGGLIALGVVYFVVSIIFSVVLFIFREFGVPLMFRHRIYAWPAFRESMNLMARYPGSVALFVLLRIALAIGLIVVSILVCCATCCIGTLPYIGTVLLLPALIYLRCFTLDCLAQFGPDNDVWIVDVPVTPATGVAPLSPPPPPG